MVLDCALPIPDVIPGLSSVEKTICMLQDCKRTKDSGRARVAYLRMCSAGLDAHYALGNHVVPMFVECEDMFQAHRVFDRLMCRNEYSWTSLIQGYVECGHYQLAFDLYPEMRKYSVTPSTQTFVALLKGCAKLKDLQRGRKLHAEVVREMLENDPFIGNTLVNLYFKCESLVDGGAVFEELPTHTIISWNALMGGYVDQGLAEEALKCLEQMHSEGFSPDEFTLVPVLKACGMLEATNRGQEAHAMIVKKGFEGENVIGNALVDMYVKCGLLVEARTTFGKLSVRDIISWTSLIVGYAEQAHGEEAHSVFKQLQLESLSLDVVLWSAVILGYAEQGRGGDAFSLFYQMQEQGLLPNRITFLNVLKACSKLSSPQGGNRIHAQLYNGDDEASMESNIFNSLVDMYGKCGNLDLAQQLFDTSPTREIVRWNALITAYARQGDTKQVFHLYERMRDNQVRPDEVTLLSVLVGCSHGGLVSKGVEYLETMSHDFGISPSANHFNCLIDLLGRAGQLHEAVRMLKRSFSTDIVGWSALLCACQKWGDVESGKEAFQAIVSLNDRHGAAIVMMSHIYANANMWEDAKRVEAMRLRLCMDEEKES